MKKISLFVLTATICLILYCCNKGTSTNNITPINCNGLITDTLGKNDSARVFIGNAFTPNGDGINDYFPPSTYKIDSIDFTIYDDSNNVIFNTTKIGRGWAPSIDTVQWRKYYYRIQATTSKKNKIGLCGEVYKLICIPKFLPKDSLRFAIPNDPITSCP